MTEPAMIRAWVARVLAAGIVFAALTACASPVTPDFTPTMSPLGSPVDSQPFLSAPPDLPGALGGGLPVDYDRAEQAYDALVSASQTALEPLGITAVISPTMTALAEDGSVALTGLVLSSSNPQDEESAIFVLPGPDGQAFPIIHPSVSMLAGGTVLSPIQLEDGSWVLGMTDPTQQPPFSDVFGIVSPDGRYGKAVVFPSMGADAGQGNNIRTDPDISASSVSFNGADLKLQPDGRTPFSPDEPLVVNDGFVWALVPLQDGSSGWMAVYDIKKAEYSGADPDIGLQGLVQQALLEIPKETATPILSRLQLTPPPLLRFFLQFRLLRILLFLRLSRWSGKDADTAQNYASDF